MPVTTAPTTIHSFISDHLPFVMLLTSVSISVRFFTAVPFDRNRCAIFPASRIPARVVTAVHVPMNTEASATSWMVP